MIIDHVARLVADGMPNYTVPSLVLQDGLNTHPTPSFLVSRGLSKGAHRPPVPRVVGNVSDEPRSNFARRFPVSTPNSNDACSNSECSDRELSATCSAAEERDSCLSEIIKIVPGSAYLEESVRHTDRA